MQTVLTACQRVIGNLSIIWNIIKTRLSLQYRSTHSNRNHEKQWEIANEMGCYYLLVINGLCYYQDRDNYPPLVLALLTVVVCSYISVSKGDPNNYGQYCIPVISIINLTTLDLLATHYNTIPFGISLAMLAYFIFFAFLLHAKLWINGVTTINAIFAPLLALHIIFSIELLVQYSRNGLFIHIFISIIFIFIHFNNIFNGHLIGFQNDLLFFISSILFINWQNMIQIAASFALYDNVHTLNVIVLTILSIQCGMICVFGIGFEFTLITLPSIRNSGKISLPYFSCILFGFVFENICIILYWYQWYYSSANIVWLLWLICSMPCIVPFVIWWYLRENVTFNSHSSYNRGNAQWHPYHNWILNEFINNKMCYPFILNKEEQYQIIDRIFCVIHCAQCKISQYADLFGNIDGGIKSSRTKPNRDKSHGHEPFDGICLKNQQEFTKLEDDKARLMFIDDKLNKYLENENRSNKRDYISIIMLLLIMKIVSYLLCLINWRKMIYVNHNNDNLAMDYLRTYLILPILTIYVIIILPYLYNLCIVCYYEYYYSYIWFISSRSMFVDKARVEKFNNQLGRNRIIWKLIEPTIVASKIIEFLQYDSNQPHNNT